MKCLDCGKEIPLARSQAVPDTKYCIKCVNNHIKPLRGILSGTEGKQYHLSIESGYSAATLLYEARKKRNKERSMK